MANQQVATRDNKRTVNRAWEMTEFKEKFEQAAPTIMPLLPAHISAERFRSMVVTEVAYNDKLWVCPIKSIIQSVRDAADLGLSLNKNMKEADILPIWSPNGTVAQLRPRYEGLMKLARQSGDITDIWAHVVYEHDEFQYSLGLNKELVHNPAREDQRGDMLQVAYCCWRTKDGNTGFEVIGPKRIARAKAASEGFKAFQKGTIKSTPWVTDEEEMIRKTAIRAASKYMPKSTESDRFQRALAMADDTRLDDDDGDRMGVASEPRVVPPRPTRESIKAAQERQRKEDIARQTHGREIQREDAAHDEDTGEIIDVEQEGDQADADDEPGPDREQGGTKAKEKDMATSKPAQAQPEPAMSAAEFRQFMLKKLTKEVSTAAHLDAVEKDYAGDLARLKEEAPEEWDKVDKAIKGKRAAYAAKR